MRTKIILFYFLSFLSIQAYSQTLFKGLDYGMSKKEVNSEFRKNKSLYQDIDLGSGISFQVYKQWLEYDDNGKLYGVVLAPKNTGTHELAVQNVEYSKSAFEKLGYEVIHQDENWNNPVLFTNSSKKWALLMKHPEKETLLHIYPSYAVLLGQNQYNMRIKVYRAMDILQEINKNHKESEEALEDSGF